MDKLLPDLYSSYGRYINEFRAFPSILDGCKIVERRLLMSLHEEAKDHLVKSVKVVGHCLANYHGHGDQSAYSSLVGLVQNGLAIGQGNWGNDVGVETSPPAAMRYTETRMSKEILSLAFEYIKDVPYKALELEEEPIFIPTKLPICLIGEINYCCGLGFGYRTLIPCYTKSDLLKRLQWLLADKNGIEPIIKPITDCTYLSTETEFKQLLTTGNSKIDYEGKFHIDGRNSIIVTSVPPSRSFTSILKKFEKEIAIEKSLGWQDESKDKTRVRFTIIKPRCLSLPELTNKMKIALKGSLTFECNVCNTSGKVVTLSIDQMLLNVYNVYKQVVDYVLKKNIQDIQNSIDELLFIEKIKPLLSIQLKQNPDDIDLVLFNIAKSLDTKIETIKSLFDKYTISRIFRVKTDTAKLKSEQNDIQTKLNNITTYIWNEKYASIK